MKKSKILLFLYASTTLVFIDFIGRLMLAEVIALITLPFINIGKLLKQYKELQAVLAGLSILLFSQIVSDFANGSVPSDYLRGWAVILFAMVSTVFLVRQLSKDPNNIVVFIFAMFLIQLIFAKGPLDFGIWEQNTNYFKTRFVGFLNNAMMLVGFYLFRKRKQGPTIFLFFAYALICMALDARACGVIFLISSLLLSIKVARIRLSQANIFVLGIISFGLLYTGFVFYVNRVLYHGFGGSSAYKQLSMASNPYNPFELIYYGRSDCFVLIQAIMDKPIFGHGSWGRDLDGEYARLCAFIKMESYSESSEFIRAHSIILGAWAYSGILGFTAVSFIYLKLFRSFLNCFKSISNLPILPVVIVVTIDMVWASLFSPFNALRSIFPFFAAVIIVCSNIDTSKIPTKS